MDLSSIAALVVAIGGIGLIYLKAPRWVAKLLPTQLKDRPEAWEDDDARADFFSKVIAGAAMYFFSGIEDVEGNEMEPRAAALMWVNQLTQAEHDRIMHELPFIMSSMSSTKTAKSMQEKSAFSRGVADVGEGIPFQAIKKTATEIFAGIGAGATGGGGKGMGLLSQLMPLYQQAQESGLIDKFLGGGGQAQEEQSQFVPRTGSPV